MKPDELREMSEEALAAKLAELEEELFNLRFQHRTGQLDNPMRLRQVRRDIARIKTIQSEQARAGEAERGRRR